MEFSVHSRRQNAGSELHYLRPRSLSIGRALRSLCRLPSHKEPFGLGQVRPSKRIKAMQDHSP